MTGTLAERLGRVGTASLVDAVPEAAWMGPSIRRVWTPARFAAPAFTVQGPAGDNRPLHHAIADAPPGHAVVAAAGADRGVAIFGDLLSRVATARGLAALVTDGAVRDTDGIAALGFPVFCGGVALPAPVKQERGAFHVPVTIGFARVEPGDWIVGDGDGVVVIPAMSAEAAADAAESTGRREADIARRAIAGESTPAQLGFG
jgi:4-hydroxy-4-methyl-2-oxoglutarate aldolase